MPAKSVTSITLLVLVLLATNVGRVHAAEPLPNEVLEQQLRELETDTLEEQLRELEETYQGYIPDISLRSILSMLKGEKEFSFGALFHGVVRYFLREIIVQFSLLVKLVILAVFTVVIGKLQGAFGSTISQIAYTVAYLVLMVLAVESFALAIGVARDAITDMLSFMVAVFPLLLTLLASLGHMVSVAMFDPLLVMASQAVGNLVCFVVLPLFYAAGVLTLVDNMSDSISIGRIANLVKTAGAVVLGTAFTVYTGLTIMRGSAGAVADGIALRTGKYVTKSFLPVVGSMIADAFETVLGCSLLLKNALGVFGLVLVMIICSFPALKITAFIFIYRLAAACIEPLGDERIPRSLSAVASVLTYVLAAVITIAVMLFIVITVTVIAGNAAVMLR